MCYKLLVIVCICWGLAIQTEEVNFVIKRLPNDEYNIKITPQKISLDQLYAASVNALIEHNTKTNLDTFEIKGPTSEFIKNKPQSNITTIEAKLDRNIRTKIINSMVYDTTKSNNTINVTVELANPTTFNSAYRELYNDIRTFSQELAAEQMQRGKSPVTFLDRIKIFIGWKKAIEEESDIEQIAILPDLAPQESLISKYPKSAAAAGILTGLAATYAYLKSRGQ